MDLSTKSFVYFRRRYDNNKASLETSPCISFGDNLYKSPRILSWGRTFLQANCPANKKVFYFSQRLFAANEPSCLWYLIEECIIESTMFAITPRADDLSDLFQLADEFARPLYDPRELRALRNATNLAQLASSLGESEVHNTDKEFRIRLNLPYFRPDEVKITSDNKRVSITAKHEEKEDKHGSVSREITRIYTLPPDVDPKSVTSTMSSTGVLSIRACKQALEPPKDVPIPVEYKGC